MGNSQGRDNVKKRAARRKKTERLALEEQAEGSEITGGRGRVVSKYIFNVPEIRTRSVDKPRG